MALFFGPLTPLVLVLVPLSLLVLVAYAVYRLLT